MALPQEGNTLENGGGMFGKRTREGEPTASSTEFKRNKVQHAIPMTEPTHVYSNQDRG